MRQNLFLIPNFLTYKLASSVVKNYDVEHCFEENNKSGIVLADLAGTHDSLLYGTKAKAPPLPLTCC